MGARLFVAPGKGRERRRWREVGCDRGKEGERGCIKRIFARRFPASFAPPGRAFLGTSEVPGQPARPRPYPRQGNAPECAQQPGTSCEGSYLCPSYSLPDSGGKENPTSLARWRSTFLMTWDVILPPYKGLQNHFVPLNNECWELLLYVLKKKSTLQPTNGINAKTLRLFLRSIIRCR